MLCVYALGRAWVACELGPTCFPKLSPAKGSCRITQTDQIMKRNLLSFGAILWLSALSLVSCSKKSPDPAPVANFQYTGTGVAPATVSFTNSSTNATNYTWDFGDNSISTEVSPSHTYQKGGVYTVSLTASGPGGLHVTTKTVNIQSPTLVKITKVRVTAMPFLDGNGAGWDSFDGPDVYFKLSDAQDNTLQEGNEFSNVTQGMLPLTWLVNPNFSTTSLSATFKLILWDSDAMDPDDFIGGYNFNFAGFTQNGYPGTIKLELPGNSLKVELDLVWQ